MRYAFRSWAEAMFHANSEAFKTGLRHRVSVTWAYVGMRPLWRVEPITRPMMRVVDWPEKVALANEARLATRKETVDFAIH